MKSPDLSSPGIVAPDETLHLTAMLNARVADNPARPFAETRNEDGTWNPVTLGEFHDQVRAVAKGLIASGMEAGDRVAIVGQTSLEWSVVDFAVLAAGGVSVPVYPSSSDSQFTWVVDDAGARIVATDANLSHGYVGEGKAPTVVTMDAAGLDSLAVQGAEVSDEEFDARTADVVASDIATIIYTSGTTGRPKGAMLTHRNMVEHALNVEADDNFGLFVRGESRVLLFLPLAHVFARFAMVLALSSGSVIGYAPSHQTLAADLKSFRPTWMPLVPRVLETIYNKADASMKGPRKTIFRWAAQAARDWSMAQENGGPSIGLKARHAIADKLVLAKIRTLLGGQLGYVLAGGAKLTPEVGHFFRGVGLTVLQGYGLTETTAASTGTPIVDNVMGTIGRPIAGADVRVDDDGEILIRGVNVFAGYWNAPEATAEVMDGEWFRTGDLGAVENGHLSVVGRKKQILVLSSGKNVQPAVLEDAMRSHPAIQDTVVVGEGRHFVSALVALDEALLPDWLTMHDLPQMTIEEASTNERVKELLGRVIAAANEHVSRAEAIKEFRILDRGFSEAREEMTASLKIRREVVLQHFSEVVDGIYSGAKPPSAA